MSGLLVTGSLHARVYILVSCASDLHVTNNIRLQYGSLVILASLLNTQKGHFKMQISKVNKQSGTTDCGAFAAAYCTALTFGEYPSAVIYD